MGMISAEEKSRLKDMGILLNRDGQYFSVRVITENGVIDHLKMRELQRLRRSSETETWPLLPG